MQLLASNLGKPEDGIGQYEEHSVYTGQTHHTDDLSSLEDVKIRLYTELDTVWWKQNRMNEYEDTNAFAIKQLVDDLTERSGNRVEYIATEDRGYRANGDRHPHAWSVAEVDALIRWMME